MLWELGAANGELWAVPGLLCFPPGKSKKVRAVEEEDEDAPQLT